MDGWRFLTDGYLVKQLQDEFRRGRVVLVVGAGVSTASSGVPGWRDIVRSAISHLHEVQLSTIQENDTLLTDLDLAATPNALVEIAARVRSKLIGGSVHSGEFAAWLQQTFDTKISSVTNPELLRAIGAMPAGLIVTTNYDRLLEFVSVGSESVTWRDSHRLLLALRNGIDIVHLHGVWNDPDSVIFGSADYNVNIRDPAYQTFLRTLWLDRTLVFIGCSFDGMSDPDFAALLNWAETTFPHAATRHFALMRSNVISMDLIDDFLNRWRIQLLSYGDDYGELVPFLENLTPNLAMSSPIPPAVLVGRARIVSNITIEMKRNQRVLVHGLSGIGKTAVVASAIASLREDNPNVEPVWVNGQNKLLPDLCREIGERLGINSLSFIADVELPIRIRHSLSQLDNVVIVLESAPDSEQVNSFARVCVPDNVAVVVVAQRNAPGFQHTFHILPLDRVDAEQLFQEISPSAINDPLVGKICSLLEGHPLAIVLAASRHATDELPLQRLFDRLSDETHRLATLRDVEKSETVSTSVRAALNLTIEALPSQLKTLVTLLAAFQGDISLPLLSLTVGSELVEVEDMVGRLISRSLVARSPGGILHLHLLVRDAARQLDEEQLRLGVREVERATISFIEGMDLTSSRSRRELLDNINHVLSFIDETQILHSVDRQLAATWGTINLFQEHGVLRLCSLRALERVWSEKLTSKALALLTEVNIPELKMILLQCKAGGQISMGLNQEALVTLQQALDLVASDDSALERSASIKCQMGNVLSQLFDYQNAELKMREGLRDAEASGIESAIAQLTGQLAHVLLQSGRLEEAQDLYETARDIYSRENQPIGVAACAFNLAEIAERQGKMDAWWSLQVEGLEAETLADNIDGALGSLEALAGRADNAARLHFVIAETDSLLKTLPYATHESHTGIGASIKGLAYMVAGDYPKSKEFLKEATTSRASSKDDHGQAVALGRLSTLANLENQHQKALEYNQESLTHYQRSGDIKGVNTCSHNGISLALAVDDIQGAVFYSCSSIMTCALLGDLESVVKSYFVLISEVVPRMGVEPEIYHPTVEPVFDQLMGILAGAADALDVGRIIGTMQVILFHFGPGGISFHPDDSA